MRLHGLLLRLYPRSFREEYGRELGAVFVRRRRDIRGPAALTALWAGEVADTVGNATLVHVDLLRQDLRQAARAIRRTPGFFAACVAVTALGIGATTAAVALTDHVLVRPLPFPEAGRLVKIWQGERDRPTNLRGLGGLNDVSPANFRDWKARSAAFADMGAYTTLASNLVGAGRPERVTGAGVTAGVLETVGVTPAIGRGLTADDDVPGAPCVVLIADGWWRAHLGGDPSVLGRSLVLDDEACDVVGVMPAGFGFPSRDTAFWRPMRFPPGAFEDRNDTYLRVIARLTAETTREQAAADLAVVSARLAEEHPADNESVVAIAIDVRDEVTDDARLLIYALAGASLCVLLIACTNLASLLLARSTARARELAVRAALGAGADRLRRQLLTEMSTIAIAGGTLGVAIASGAAPLAARLVPTALPIAEAPGLDARLLLIAAAVTLVTLAACSVLPALRAARLGDAMTLRDGVRAGESRRTERVRGALVVAQISASVTLLVCTGLLLRALWKVQDVDPGFRPDGVLTMRLNLPWPQYAPEAARERFYRRVLEDVTALPGVDGAAFASYLPLTMRGGVWGVYLPGQPQDVGREAQMALVRFVTPAYFDVLGIPLAAGRTFDARDTPAGVPTAIVSRTFGDAVWPGEPLVGRRFVLMGTERTIIGVVGEVRVRGLERRSEPQLYLPDTQQPDNSFIGYTPRDLAVRLSGEPGHGEDGLIAAIRDVVAEADPQLPISDVRPLTAIVEADSVARRVQARALGAFAAVACLLAAVGVHGLLSFMVSVRTREIGVRLALGADRRAVAGLIMGRALRLGAIGIVLGFGAALVAARSVRAVLAGVDPADAATVVAAAGLTLAVTLAGGALSAVRAARTSPLEATRD